MSQRAVDTTVTVDWQDPPPGIEPVIPKGEHDGKLKRLVSALSEQPGRWARVADYAGHGTATGTAALLRRYGCDTAIDGWRVYARWPEVSA